MQKLLIADHNEDFRLALADALRSRFHVLCCHSGKDALALLREEQPDAVVLDLMLPELDGLTLLETIVAEGLHPNVLAVTSLVTPYVLDSAQRLGIGYIMRKPCDVQAAALRLCDLAQCVKAPVPKPDKRTLVSQHLLALNILPKYDGYHYLVEAILMTIENPHQSVTKELYPAVAKIFGCKGVERSIRNALDIAWAHRDPALWQKYFPDAVKRPSNAVFLSRIAEEVRLAAE